MGDALAGCEPGELVDQPGADPASVVAVGDLEGELRVVGAPREAEVLRCADEEVAVERPDGQVVRADGDEACDVSRRQRADEPKVSLVARLRRQSFKKVCHVMPVSGCEAAQVDGAAGEPARSGGGDGWDALVVGLDDELSWLRGDVRSHDRVVHENAFLFQVWGARRSAMVARGAHGAACRRRVRAGSG